MQEEGTSKCQPHRVMFIAGHRLQVPSKPPGFVLTNPSYQRKKTEAGLARNDRKSQCGEDTNTQQSIHWQDRAGRWLHITALKHECLEGCKTGAMAQSVECLLHQHEDLSSGSQHTRGQLGMVGYVYKPTAGETNTGGSLAPAGCPVQMNQ